MMKIEIRNEQGQSLVFIILMLTGIMALLGLIFDASNAFSQRRAMQNSADAAALAGARVFAIRTDNSAATEQAILSAITTYATSNGAPTQIVGYFVSPSGTQVGAQIGLNGGVPGSLSRFNKHYAALSTATGIRVITTKDFSSFFLGVMGQQYGSVNATATVQTGKTGTPTTGLMPVAVPRCYVDSSYSNPALCGSSATTTTHVILGQGAQDPSGSSSFRGIINLKNRENPINTQVGCGHTGDKQDAEEYIENGGYNNECGPVNYNDYIDVLTGNSNGNAGVDAFKNSPNLYPVNAIILVAVYPEGTVPGGTTAQVQAVGFAAMQIMGYGSNYMNAKWAGTFIVVGPIDNTGTTPPWQTLKALQLSQ